MTLQENMQKKNEYDKAQREKEIKNATMKYVEENSIDGYVAIEDHKDSFIEEAELSDKNQKNTWIKWKDKKPKEGIEVIAYHHKWVDEDFNPNGTRIGFINGDGEFTSAYWWDYQDCYTTINFSSCLEEVEFYRNHIDNTEPEMWMPIPSPIKIK